MSAPLVIAIAVAVVLLVLFLTAIRIVREYERVREQVNGLTPTVVTDAGSDGN